jgi:hypothetical protein
LVTLDFGDDVGRQLPQLLEDALPLGLLLALPDLLDHAQLHLLAA